MAAATAEGVGGFESGMAAAEAAAAAQPYAAIAGGFAAGGIQGGNLESALSGAWFASVSFGIGNLTMVNVGDSDPAKFAGNMMAHAALGCGQQAWAGGSCKAGAAAGGFSAAAGAIPQLQAGGFAGGLLSHVAIGAAASKLAGGSAEDGAITASFEYLFNFLYHQGGRLWAVKPTADEYAAHYWGGTGETIYRMGSDVSLAEYAPNAFSFPVGTSRSVTPNFILLGAGLANWERGLLTPGPLTDAFIYGSLNNVQNLGNGFVQLAPDEFNYDMHSGGWSFRDQMTALQHSTLGRGLPGKNFTTIFV
jgi:hypothetical protein